MIEPPKPIVVEFRDGKRQVPEYLAVLMTDIETHRLTFEQAITEANKRMEANFLNEAGQQVIVDHFRKYRRLDREWE